MAKHSNLMLSATLMFVFIALIAASSLVFQNEISKAQTNNDKKIQNLQATYEAKLDSLYQELNTERDILASVKANLTKLQEQDAGKLDEVDVLGRSKLAVVGVYPLKTHYDTYASWKEAVFATGSGVVIHYKGLIVTNYHVVQPSIKAKTPILVRLGNGQQYFAELKNYNAGKDIAILQLTNVRNPLPYLRFADTVKVGEKVYAIGNPFGLEATITQGIVSAIRNYGFKIVQTDAAMNPGNSGGPIINSKGEIVAISSLGRQEAENIGFAIHLEEVEELARNFY
jgi:S1-C subfamily serine protease